MFIIYYIKLFFSAFLAQLVERVTSNDEVSRSNRLEGICFFILLALKDLITYSFFKLYAAAPTLLLFVESLRALYLYILFFKSLSR